MFFIFLSPDRVLILKSKLFFQVASFNVFLSDWFSCVVRLNAFYWRQRRKRGNFEKVINIFQIQKQLKTKEKTKFFKEFVDTNKFVSLSI